MSQWHAKVHKSGSKVAVFNGSKLVKVVEASDETFQPAEAQKFAENLVDELTERTSAQMSNGNEQPSVTTDTELHVDSLEAVNTQAQGKGADEASVVAEAAVEEKAEEEVVVEEPAQVVAMKKTIASLQKKLATEKNERLLERKARRGLAIAKQMVIEGSLEDSYEAIKNKVAEITKLEESEIDRLERKVANESEYDSIEDAQKDLRRQARLARIHRQAAAEAQEDKDEEQADNLDSKADIAEAKAAYIQDVIEQMKKHAEEEVKEEIKPEEAAEVEEKPAEAPVTEEKVASEEEVKEESKAEETPETEEKSTEAPVTEEKTASEENPQMILAKSYRLIASTHRKNAEAAEVAGDIAKADAEDAKADEAEEKAEEIENKLASDSCETPSEEAKEEEKEDETAEDESEVCEEKTASKREPGKIASKPDYSALKREGNTIDEFGIDKNASLVEQNDYFNDPEVEILSKMWRSAPKDEE